MRISRGLMPLAALIAIAVVPLEAQNPFDEWQHFSATRTGGPIKREPMKMYRSGENLRIDHPDQGNYQITNLEDRTSVVVMTNTGQCYRLPMADGPSYPFSAVYPPTDFKTERTTLEGEETVDGHKCRVESITFTQKDQGVAVRMKLWKAEDLKGFPIRIEVEPPSRSKFTLNYTNISMQPPDPKLFERPANCPEIKSVVPLAQPPAPAKTQDPSQKVPKPVGPSKPQN